MLINRCQKLSVQTNVAVSPSVPTTEVSALFTTPATPAARRLWIKLQSYFDNEWWKTKGVQVQLLVISHLWVWKDCRAGKKKQLQVELLAFRLNRPSQFTNDGLVWKCSLGASGANTPWSGWSWSADLQEGSRTGVGGASTLRWHLESASTSGELGRYLAQRLQPPQVAHFQARIASMHTGKSLWGLWWDSLVTILENCSDYTYCNTTTVHWVIKTDLLQTLQSRIFSIFTLIAMTKVTINL